ncbi:hypothetical protein RB213_004945 [Colletotrichum asianum]
MPAISIQDGAAGDIEANSDSGDKLSKDSNVFALPFPLAFQPTAISRFGNASANASNTRKWARRKRVRSIDWNPFPDPPAPASNIGVTDDSGDESTNDVDIFERFQRHRSPSCSPTPDSERPHLPMYDKDLQAGSIELGIYNIPQHLSTSTWNKHRKPVVFSDKYSTVILEHAGSLNVSTMPELAARGQRLQRTKYLKCCFTWERTWSS